VIRKFLQALMVLAFLGLAISAYFSFIENEIFRGMLKLASGVLCLASVGVYIEGFTSWKEVRIEQIRLTKVAKYLRLIGIIVVIAAAIFWYASSFWGILS
jgi:hypothetical protein